MNSAEVLCQRIIEEAKAAVLKKQAETDAEVKNILDSAREKANAVTEAGNAEIQRVKSAYEERESIVCQKAVRNAVLLEKAKIINKLVDDTKKALCALEGDAYVDFIKKLYEGCDSLTEPSVYLQKNRQPLKEQLVKALGTSNVFFSDAVEGGILIKEADIDYDCRVGTVLERFRTVHEPELQQLLFGE